jgi:hypothetical protein
MVSNDTNFVSNILDIHALFVGMEGVWWDDCIWLSNIWWKVGAMVDPNIIWLSDILWKFLFAHNLPNVGKEIN